MRITKEQRQILEFLAASLFGRTAKVFPDIDAEIIFEEAKIQTILPLIYQALRSYTTEEKFQKIQDKVIAVCVTNIRINCEHTELHELMTSNKIPYVVIKGPAAAAYYPQPELRVMGDVDFLVPSGELEHAGKVLEQAGFLPVEENDNTAHIAYHRNRTAWEMHWEVNGIPGGKAGVLIRQYLSDVIEQAELIRTEEGVFYVPSRFHHGLIILLHIATHMINTGIGLRHLCDWAVFVNGITDEEFSEVFEEKLKAVGLWRFAQLLTLLSVKYLHCRSCKWAGTAESELLKAMMADIYAGGNFGKKDSERINQAKLMTDKEKGSVDDTGFGKQLIRTMNEKARIGMPIVEKVPFLLPAGWIYVGIRHMIRIRSGTRPKIHLGATFQGALHRKEIYQSFALFHPEK